MRAIGGAPSRTPEIPATCPSCCGAVNHHQSQSVVYCGMAHWSTSSSPTAIFSTVLSCAMPYAIVMHVEKTAAKRIAALWHVLAERDHVGRVKFSDEQIRFNYTTYYIER